jgi:hypothetical protein
LRRIFKRPFFRDRCTSEKRLKNLDRRSAIGGRFDKRDPASRGQVLMPCGAGRERGGNYDIVGRSIQRRSAWLQ